MRRLISRIGKRTPREIAEENQKRAVILPSYVAATRKGQGITIVVKQLVKMHDTGITIAGYDEHKEWGWHSLYGISGQKVADTGTSYAGPQHIFSAFVLAVLEGRVLNSIPGVPSQKDIHDRLRRERFMTGNDHDNDREWRQQLTPRQFDLFMAALEWRGTR